MQACSQGFEKGGAIFCLRQFLLSIEVAKGVCGGGDVPPAIGGFGGPPPRQF
ncbi:hypothetical protein DPMN_015972 [Dreissena polymorpha]|uniref:Uncharacterized protein n=1 Tax=Dreissena polymorpha TaxID=45954 RepID=A0A9D4N8T6_DREPO|nr:hypothetical protein DPMN_015972 [Dreissena polymorpha]